MAMNLWKCSDNNCTVVADIDNQLGYDVKVNVVCDGSKIILLEIKPIDG